MTVARNAGKAGFSVRGDGWPPIQELIEHRRQRVALERRSSR